MMDTGSIRKQNVPEQKIMDIYKDLIKHDGFGQFVVEVKILKRGQKEVIVHFGKQFRYVVDAQKSEVNKILQGDEGSQI